jgi:hypothetical protein
MGQGVFDSENLWDKGILAPEYICSLYLKYIFNIFKNINIFFKMLRSQSRFEKTDFLCGLCKIDKI